MLSCADDLGDFNGSVANLGSPSTVHEFIRCDIKLLTRHGLYCFDKTTEPGEPKVEANIDHCILSGFVECAKPKVIIF